MLCSVIPSISYQDLLGFLKIVILQKIDIQENFNESKKLQTKDLQREENKLVFVQPGNEKRAINGKFNFEDITANDLEIGERLGAGGFGAVFTARYRSRKYALKKMHRMSTRAAKESYQAEASIIHLRHPNIVRTHSLFTMDDSACILMEFVSKRTLEKVIADVDNEELNENRRLRFALDMSRGLSYAHGKGIAHLDIKPTNILITNNDVCKICDFGCCQSMESSDPERPSSPTKSNLTGTYAYRAPELFRGEFATPKCDIYSVGICLWQMLSREKPYGSKNQHCVIFGVVAYNMRPVITDEMNCGARYRQLMEQCWNKDPLRRPAAAELAKALDMTLTLPSV